MSILTHPVTVHTEEVVLAIYSESPGTGMSLGSAPLSQWPFADGKSEAQEI